jgi:hypothetical protein
MTKEMTMPNDDDLLDDDLLDDDLREVANQAWEAVRLTMERGLAAGADDEITLPDDTDSLERLAQRFAARLEPTLRQRATQRAITELRSAPLVATGSVKPSSPTSMLDQVAALPPVRRLPVEQLRPKFTLPSKVKLPVGIGEAWRQKDGTPIDAAHRRLGGDAGVLGPATAPERDAPGGRGRCREYERGSIYWTQETGAHEVHGAIRSRWLELGGHSGVLGFPITDETATPDGAGRFNHFDGGSIYWTESTGAFEVRGAIRQKWADLGWERGYLGYPVTNETTTPDGIGRFNHFEGGSIYWAPHRGAHAVNVFVRNGWEQRGWETGFLGYPMSDTADVDGELSNRFEGGVVRCRAGKQPVVETPYTKLALRLHRVYCDVETNELGNDDIFMGGVAIDANGKTAKAKAWKVGTFGSDKGDHRDKRYSPPKTLWTFTLPNSTGWPKSFLFNLILCEEDWGGFAEELQKILEKVTAYVKKELEKALAGALAGAGVGATLAGVVGAVIGLVVGFVVGALAAWITDVADDDLFVPIPITGRLDSVHQRWDGRTNSKNREWWVKSHGGKYRVWTDWELRA